jgi:DNA polymerase III alpha subunit
MSAEIPRPDRRKARRSRAAHELVLRCLRAGALLRRTPAAQHAEITDLNRKLVELGAKYSAKFVATNDVHYIEPG